MGSQPPPRSDDEDPLEDLFPKEGGSYFKPRGRRRRTEATPGLSPGKRVGDFELIDLLGQGAMGQVWAAQQLSLARRVALKFVRPERVTPKQLELFQREARAGGRLHHAAIVTVYAHGQDAGLAWIAMELVEEATTLRDWLKELLIEDSVPEGHDARVAGLVAEIADAMEVAHRAGVIHRDLKPENILIGADDSPHVTDFGLARLTDESALSQTGEFAGTYAYMSPEQVAAKRMGIDHRTDVFSLGIMLYEMLALRRPFEGDTPHQLALQVGTKNPPALRSVRSRIARDLEVIANKALEKDPDRRYPTMAELAADLRRHLADEPIHARSPSRVERITKWARRNPGPIAAIGAVALALAVISGLLIKQVRTASDLAKSNKLLEETAAVMRTSMVHLQAETRRAESGEREAREYADRARKARDEATARANEVLSLSAQRDHDDLVLDAAKLWPAHPEMIPAYEDWLRRANELIDGRPAVETKGVKWRPSLGEHKAKLAELSTARDKLAEEVASTYGFDDPERQAKEWWNRQLMKLVSDLEALRDPATGLMNDVIGEPFGWGVSKRHEFAKTIGERSVHGLRAKQLWDEAITAIQSSSNYGGLTIVPQMGLLPIGMDPDSKLWEFAHLQTGDPAMRAADGRLLLTEDTGLVFVLIPGGEFWMGAQATDPNGRNYDPQAAYDEGPVHEVTLSPYFLSKYEMTQGQWQRIAAVNPSRPDTWRSAAIHNDTAGFRMPVEKVSWSMCSELMFRLGLSLPSEEQWERGTRGGTSSPYSSTLLVLATPIDTTDIIDGIEVYWPGVRLFVTVSPSRKQSAFLSWNAWEVGHDASSTLHTAVGRLSANPFGLHDVHGNVWEWCSDVYAPRFGSGLTLERRDGPTIGSANRVNRGGGSNSTLSFARSTHRNATTPETRDYYLGLRPARQLSNSVFPRRLLK